MPPNEVDLNKVAEQIGEIGTAITTFRTRLDTLEKSNRGTGEVREMIDKAIADITNKFASMQEIKDLAAAQDEIRGLIERGKENQDRAGVKMTAHRNATFDVLKAACDPAGYSQRTHDFINSAEYRTLMESEAPSGGFLVDPFTEAGIIKKYVEVDPLRSVANVVPISKGNEVRKYREVGTPSATWEGELGAGTNTNQTFEELRIPINAMIARTAVSGDLLDDVPYIEAEATESAARQFSYTEGVAFLEGTGVKKPRGVLHGIGTDDDIYPAVITGNGTQIIDGDDFADLLMGAKAFYHANWTWGFNRNSCAKILQIKQTSGAYLWQPVFTNGLPTLILAHPFILCENMDNEGNDVYPVMGGDFRAGYYIADRQGIVVQRDPYTDFPKVIFKWRKRVGGQVVLPEAIKVLKTT